jgi:hypothetical protein
MVRRVSTVTLKRAVIVVKLNMTEVVHVKRRGLEHQIAIRLAAIKVLLEQMVVDAIAIVLVLTMGVLIGPFVLVAVLFVKKR